MSGARRETVIRLLADGACHSGESVAQSLGVSRSAVWKHVQALAELGLEVEAVRGRGYRVGAPFELLDAGRIIGHLPADVSGRIERLERFLSLPSTNSHLLGAAPPEPGRAQVCLTEHQSAGRGRRGRRWQSALGGGLCLSIGWRYAEQPPQLSALSLAIGVAVHAALTATGIQEVMLKWPNDLLWQDRKLGGVLIELNVEAGGPAHVVTGIGLNLRLGRLRRSIEREGGDQVVDLAEICGPDLPSRNALAASIVADCVRALVRFGDEGFAPFVGLWNDLDAYADRDVEFILDREIVQGTAQGVDEDGALRIDSGGRVRRFVSGEISPRAARH
ncbi:MAG TPA: biotin--[acetyl-CoA-carboxylase] ligase [Gammaproteobacteria bacterium]|nr:biotin--[acetyl-CoA-carboxylase] ligase [Gammaproteobacteria bacterium]